MHLEDIICQRYVRYHGRVYRLPGGIVDGRTELTEVPGPTVFSSWSTATAGDTVGCSEDVQRA